MISQIHRNKRSAILASALFLVLLIFTWHSLNLESLLPAPLLRGGHSKLPYVSARFHQVTCPAPVGDEGKKKLIPVVRGRNATAAGERTIHGQTLDVPKVVVILFYGRRKTVSLLDCYLKKNLASNGGLIDEVIWLRRTEDKEDVELLEKLLQSEPHYSKRDVDRTDPGGFASAYDGLDNDTLYIKIDDDVVFIDDNAILSLICTKLTHPEYYIVSANVINQPMMSWLHWNLGAILPYLPDMKNAYPKLKSGQHVDWRASKLPNWKGTTKDLNILEWNSPEEKKHRWLPIRDRKDHLLDDTPIVNTEYDAFGKGLHHWQIAAQQHYSFFENLENDELHKYMYNTWDFQLKRVGIQFMAIMGSDINGAKPIAGDDEQHFSVTMPQKSGRPAVADGRAIVAHYSFGPQSAQMPTTDVLERYRSYAREKICTKPMLWSPDTPPPNPAETQS